MRVIEKTVIDLILDTYWRTLSSKPTRPKNLNDFQVPHFMMPLCRSGIYRRSISQQSRVAYNRLSGLVSADEAETVPLQDLLEIMGSLNFESTMMVIIYAQLKLSYSSELKGCQTLENIVRCGHTLGFGQGRYSNLYSALSAQTASCAAGNSTIDRIIYPNSTFAMCLAKEIGCRIEYNTKFDLHHMYVLSTAELQTIFNGPLQEITAEKRGCKRIDPHSLPEMARIQCEGDNSKENQLRRINSCDF